MAEWSSSSFLLSESSKLTRHFSCLSSRFVSYARSSSTYPSVCFSMAEEIFSMRPLSLASVSFTVLACLKKLSETSSTLVCTSTRAVSIVVCR